jgi:hypothetical protein
MGMAFFADDGRPAVDEVKLAPADQDPEDRPEPVSEEETGELEVEEREADETSAKREVVDAMEEVLPWVSSLLFHLGIVVLALFIVWSLPGAEEEDVVIAPSTRLTDNPGGQLAQSQDVELQSTQNVRQVQSEEVSTSDSLESLSTNLDAVVELVGVSGGASGKLAPFGTTTGGEGGLAAAFYGAGGNARKIAYLVDASGSLIDTLPFVIKELRDSVNGLIEEQQYTIIFFQDGEPIEAPPVGWKNATPENKRRTSEFIALEAGNIVPRGRTDPVKALRLAMRYKPELMFILSDNITGRGVYEVDREDLLKLLNEVNKDRKTTINTIQFLYPDPLNTLADIAAEHRGVSKFITDADLGLR